MELVLTRRTWGQVHFLPRPVPHFAEIQNSNFLPSFSSFLFLLGGRNFDTFRRELLLGKSW